MSKRATRTSLPLLSLIVAVANHLILNAGLLLIVVYFHSIEMDRRPENFF